MDNKQIQETSIWELYYKGRNFFYTNQIYSDTDKNYNFYNGNQWEQAELGDVKPVQKNIIKPIIKYKLAVIHDYEYAINYSSQNFENQEFRKFAEKICEMLNKRAARLWEQDKLNFKGRRISKDAAINDEGIIYVNYILDKQNPKNEIVKKNDIYYGNENDDEIQEQPYILIRKRMPVSQARAMALEEGISEEEVKNIIGDNDNFEESGEAAKQELDPMVTVITKMYKDSKTNTVHFAVATRYLDIKKDTDSGLTYYPVAHFNWEEKEGSARGEGEVRYLIPNQIEVNKIEIRKLITVKYQAYPMRVVDISKISNPEAVTKAGGVIRTNGKPVDDVNKIIGSLSPAQMSPDVKQAQDDLIQLSRELAGAGESATGQIDPEQASGKAILAVQNASRSTMTEQKEAYKNFIEDLARIWLDMWTVYSPDGIKLEETIIDEATGEETINLVDVPQSALQELQASVKVDVSPKSAFDIFSVELTLENFLKAGYFTPQRVGELRKYVEALPDLTSTPKQKLLEVCDKIDKEQQKIAVMNAQAQIMQEKAQQFLMGDPSTQASQIAEAEQQVAVEEEPMEEVETDE